MPSFQFNWGSAPNGIKSLDGSHANESSLAAPSARRQLPPKLLGRICVILALSIGAIISGKELINSTKDEILYASDLSRMLSSDNEHVNWNDYRLGDGVRGFDRAHGLGRDVVCGRWPSTLLCEYLTRTDELRDVSVLAEVVRDWDSISGKVVDKPMPSDTVVHLRLGDGLCGTYDQGSFGGSSCKGANIGSSNPRIPSCWDHDSDCFVNPDGAFYAYPKDFYEPVAAELLQSVGTDTRIVVLADPSHWTRNRDPRNGDYSVDFAYRDNLVVFFKSHGFNHIEVREMASPDEDFLYMSSAKNFVQGGGGFSHIIADVVTANGGRVFKPRRTSVANPSPQATIVTAYFNVKSKHSHSVYVEWMENMMSLQDPMVIYTTPNMVSGIERLRSHAADRTKIIPMKLEDMQMSQYGIEFWEKQHEMDPEKAIHKTYYTYWIWAEKLEFLRRTIQDNPFQSDFFAWVDIGYFKTKDHNNKRMFQQIPTKLQHDQVLGLDVSRTSSSLMGGSFIGGYADGLMRLHSIYYDLLEANQDKFIGKDQEWYQKACEENDGLCVLVQPHGDHVDPLFWMTPHMMGIA